MLITLSHQQLVPPPSQSVHQWQTIPHPEHLQQHYHHHFQMLLSQHLVLQSVRTNLYFLSLSLCVCVCVCVSLSLSLCVSLSLSVSLFLLLSLSIFLSISLSLSIYIYYIYLSLTLSLSFYLTLYISPLSLYIYIFKYIHTYLYLQCLLIIDRCFSHISYSLLLSPSFIFKITGTQVYSSAVYTNPPRRESINYDYLGFLAFLVIPVVILAWYFNFCGVFRSGK